MPSSQQSYEARLNRFSNGNTLIQSWADYNAANPFILNINLPAYISDVQAANLDATNLLSNLTTERNARAVRCFAVRKNEEPNPDCMELRFVAIANYLKGEFGATNSAYKIVKKIIKKIRPVYAKKPDGAPRGSGNSPMERSFASLVGQADEVISLITGIGASYAPPDPNLIVVNMQTLADEIRTLNGSVTTILDAYGTAIRKRSLLFDNKGNPPGMTERIVLIKNYLASFPGGKQSDHYIEFSQAIKGL